MKRKLAIYFLCSVWVCIPVNAYAYLDPGTGSMILQSILGAILIIGSGVGVFWGKIKGLFKRSDDSDKKN